MTRQKKLIRAYLLASSSAFAFFVSGCQTTAGNVAAEAICNNQDKIIAAAKATIAATEQMCLIPSEF